MGIATMDWLLETTVSSSLWQTASTVLNSNFSTALLGSLAGAFGGAWAAQYASERVGREKQMRDEITLTVRAIESMHPICSSYLNMNEQHLRQLVTNFDAQRARIIDHLESVRRDEARFESVCNLGAVDFRSLNPVGLNFDRVGDLLGRLSISGRARLVAGLLPQLMLSLDYIIEERNEWIKENKQSREHFISHYPAIFGLPDSRGNVDQTYMQLVHNIEKLSDDCAFFSRMLILDLVKYGHEARAHYKSQFKGAVPRIPSVDFSEPETQGLFPDSEKYKTWTHGYLSRVKQTEGRKIQRGWYSVRRRCRLLKRKVTGGLRQAPEFSGSPA